MLVGRQRSGAISCTAKVGAGCWALHARSAAVPRARLQHQSIPVLHAGSREPPLPCSDPRRGGGLRAERHFPRQCAKPPCGGFAPLSRCDPPHGPHAKIAMPTTAAESSSSSSGRGCSSRPPRSGVYRSPSPCASRTFPITLAKASPILREGSCEQMARHAKLTRGKACGARERWRARRERRRIGGGVGRVCKPSQARPQRSEAAWALPASHGGRRAAAPGRRRDA